MIDETALQGPPSLNPALESDETSADGPSVVPISASSVPAFRQSTVLTPIVCDERAISRLLERLLYNGGLSVNEASRRLGVTSGTIRQYIRGRRNKPSLIWFVRLAELCGARITIEFPNRGR